jgi:uncharacterized membrane protein
MLSIALWAWNAVPGDQLMAIHWGMSGQPDGFAPKPVALLCLPLLMAVVTLLSSFRLRSRADVINQAGAATFAYTVWVGVLILMNLAQASIALTGAGYAVPVPKLMMSGVSILLVIAGSGMYRHPELCNFGKAGPDTKRTFGRLCGGTLSVTGAATAVAALAGQLIACVLMLAAGVAAVLLLSIYAMLVGLRGNNS